MFNDVAVYNPGLIEKLLFQSYQTVSTTTAADKKSFALILTNVIIYGKFITINNDEVKVSHTTDSSTDSVYR